MMMTLQKTENFTKTKTTNPMKTKKVSNQKPQIKVFCESLGMNPGTNYFTGAAKIKFPDRVTITRRGCLPFAEEVEHNGRKYLCRYIDHLQNLPKLQAIREGRI